MEKFSYAKAGVEAGRGLWEFRLSATEVAKFESGEELEAPMFKVGQKVDVSGLNRGFGFQGGIKRHGFHRGPRTHGQSDRLRAPGALSSGTTPGRVYKGKRMAGHMGNETVTIQNVKVVAIRPEENLLLVQGGIPGPINGYVSVKFAVKKRVYV